MRRKAEAKAPSTKYFRAASWLSRRRWRAMAAMMYSGSETSSSMTNRAMRLLDSGKSIMPPRLNSVSGKTSVPVHPACRDSASSALPGRSAACAAKAPSSAVVRSAMTRTASRPMTSMTPWAATPKGSSSNPAVSEAPTPASTARQRTTTPAPAPRIARTARPGWRTGRARRGTRASRRTPRTAAPRMTATGVRPAHRMVGAVKLTWHSLRRRRGRAVRRRRSHRRSPSWRPARRRRRGRSRGGPARGR